LLNNEELHNLKASLHQMVLGWSKQGVWGGRSI